MKIKTQKGRSKELIKLRDKALVKRFVHLTEVKRKRVDDTLKILSEKEFYLSEKTILNIIRKEFRVKKYCGLEKRQTYGNIIK
ncbi:hypothetical protein [Aureibacter tunicatorum]|uniref:16S rRNA U1498 N3-methylase RsmE n=1 Tax=Aureibacter tunicatorum TaxID=866807 RepID=A0AAE4BTH8_9BACT|nr:hypothetical protein [Aureibacter tunicatorum]MDR6239950.1 16S rRNA U1498 N3-methylase RsmE [Aureibacter tunicatorum]BDD04424.1 hypothetical protein AUTU_19070 [Aureibacter tunicatorum]